MAKSVKVKSLKSGNVSYFRTYSDALSSWRSVNGVRFEGHHFSYHADMEVWRSYNGLAEPVEVSW
jgi:hypothetical protein